MAQGVYPWLGKKRAGLRRAIRPNRLGHESDVRVATIERFRNAVHGQVPSGATAPVEPPGITTLALGKTADVCCNLWDYFLEDLPASVVDRVAEVIYWDWPDGGRVFNGGAIANGVALYYNPLFAGLVRNVLRNFLR